MIGANGFTPTEERIFDLLSDGHPHSRDELFKCLTDDLADTSAIRPHLTRLRGKINPKGFDILYVPRHHKTFWQLVHLVYSPNDGRT